jgi:hypothetical protein
LFRELELGAPSMLFVFELLGVNKGVDGRL